MSGGRHEIAVTLQLIDEDFREHGKEVLERVRAKLALELKLIEGELRSDAVLRVARGRSEVALRQRSEYLRKLYR